jgi:lipopolysaccharide transport system ATP-binding protein
VEAAVRFEGVWKAFPLESPHERSTTLKRWLLELVRDRPRAARGSHAVLEDVSFEVAPGETLGIVGANGTGKSTVLRLVAGIVRPDRGRVVVGGRVAALLELGGGFHPEFTGRENVLLEGVTLGLEPGEIRAQMGEIAAFADLGAYFDQPVRTYSTGMFLRLAFAVAVRVRPDILLLDEVLAVGDEAFVAKCRAALEEIRAGGATILLVTHDLATVRSWCDRALWLEGGRVAALGDPEAVVSAYHGWATRKREEPAAASGPPP